MAKHIKKEEFQRANEVCFFDYCNDEGISAGAKENYRSSQKYKTLDGDTIVLDPHHTGAYSNLAGKPLSAVDALAKIEDITVSEAAERLLQYDGYMINADRDDYKPSATCKKPSMPKKPKSKQVQPKESEPLQLPRSCKNKFKHVAAYLLHTRGIPQLTINALFEAGLVYESERSGHYNATFRNPEGTFYEERGADPDSDFHRSQGKGNGNFFYIKSDYYQADGNVTVYVTESSIDAISLYVIRMAEEENAIYIGMGGRIPTIMTRLLGEYREDHIVLAVDNDDAGEQFRSKYPQLQSIRPQNKDWNNDLIAGRYAWELSEGKKLLEKRKKAYDLRQEGLCYDAIAKALGYNDRSAARKAVKTYEHYKEKEGAMEMEETILELAPAEVEIQTEQVESVVEAPRETHEIEELYERPEIKNKGNMPPAFKLLANLCDPHNEQFVASFKKPAQPERYTPETREAYLIAYEEWLSRAMKLFTTYLPNSSADAIRSFLTDDTQKVFYVQWAMGEISYEEAEVYKVDQNPVHTFIYNPLCVLPYGVSFSDFALKDRGRVLADSPTVKYEDFLWGAIFGCFHITTWQERFCARMLRQMAITYAVVADNEKNGDTCMTRAELIQECKKYDAEYKDIPLIMCSPYYLDSLDEDDQKNPFRGCMDLAALLHYFAQDTGYITLNNDYVSLQSTRNKECSVSQKLAHLTKNETLNMINLDHDPELSNEQNEAIDGICSNQVTFLSGGPGTGKSTIIVSLVKRLHPRYTVKVLAPTGAAVNRLNKDFEMAGLEIQAETIDAWVTKCAKIIFLDKVFDVVLVDESSMINTTLQYRLLCNIYANHLVFAGDIKQLPSISCGDLLSDLKKLHVPIYQLRENHRSIQSIRDNADRIDAGDPTILLDQHFRFIQSSYPYQDAVREYTEGSMILSPYRNPLWRVNQMIRRQRHGIDQPAPFIPGDKIMFTVNRAWRGYYNGMTGVIQERSATTITVSTSHGVLSLDIDCIKDMTYAYGVTIHKSQGSEYRKVIIVIPDGCSRRFDRRLLYTACTRAKHEVVLIGSMEEFRKIVTTVPRERKTAISLGFVQSA